MLILSFAYSVCIFLHFVIPEPDKTIAIGFKDYPFALPLACWAEAAVDDYVATV